MATQHWRTQAGLLFLLMNHTCSINSSSFRKWSFANCSITVCWTVPTFTVPSPFIVFISAGVKVTEGSSVYTDFTTASPPVACTVHTHRRQWIFDSLSTSSLLSFTLLLCTWWGRLTVWCLWQWYREHHTVQIWSGLITDPLRRSPANLHPITCSREKASPGDIVTGNSRSSQNKTWLQRCAARFHAGLRQRGIRTAVTKCKFCRINWIKWV